MPVWGEEEKDRPGFTGRPGHGDPGRAWTPGFSPVDRGDVRFPVYTEYVLRKLTPEQTLDDQSRSPRGPVRRGRLRGAFLAPPLHPSVTQALDPPAL